MRFIIIYLVSFIMYKSTRLLAPTETIGSERFWIEVLKKNFFVTIFFNIIQKHVLQFKCDNIIKLNTFSSNLLVINYYYHYDKRSQRSHGVQTAFIYVLD